MKSAQSTSNVNVIAAEHQTEIRILIRRQGSFTSDALLGLFGLFHLFLHFALGASQAKLLSRGCNNLAALPSHLDLPHRGFRTQMPPLKPSQRKHLATSPGSFARRFAPSVGIALHQAGLPLQIQLLRLRIETGVSQIRLQVRSKATPESVLHAFHTKQPSHARPCCGLGLRRESHRFDCRSGARLRRNPYYMPSIQNNRLMQDLHKVPASCGLFPTWEAPGKASVEDSGTKHRPSATGGWRRVDTLEAEAVLQVQMRNARSSGSSQGTQSTQLEQPAVQA